MRVAFISVYESIISYGLRCLSAVLKEANIPTRMIFLSRETEGHRRDGFRFAFSEDILSQIVDLTQSCDLIGIGVMSNYFENAIQVTQYLHNRISAKIIWGGIHVTLQPEECLEYADLICVGEGEDALLELAYQMEEGKGVGGIQNIWYKKNGQIVQTPIRPLEKNLDRYPYPDYSLEDTFILHNGRIQPINEELLMYYLDWPHSLELGPQYTAIMSRGCTYSCAFCNNNAYKGIYHKDWVVRRRSVKNFVNELITVIQKHPGIRCITINDDVFLDKIDHVREFCELYKKSLSLPLWITGFQPSMVDEVKISLLVDAGMKYVRMGIQTGSIETLHKIYKRPGSKEQLYRAVNVLHKYVGRIDPPLYDFIVDNPWETEDQAFETLQFMLSIPRPFNYLTFSLTFYPGTELYERAKKDGYLHDEVEQVYRKDYLEPEPKYINAMVKLFQYQFLPHWLLAFLISPKIRHSNLIWIPKLISGFCRTVELSKKGIHAILLGDWMALRRALKERYIKWGPAHESINK